MVGNEGFENLTEENYLLYAIKAYDKPNCIKSEFDEDIKRIKYLKRLFRKYKATKDIENLKHNLILNHLIILYNVFNFNALTRMLFYKIDEKDYDILKTFLIFINYMPNKITGIKGKNIISSDIAMDDKAIGILRKI